MWSVHVLIFAKIIIFEDGVPRVLGYISTLIHAPILVWYCLRNVNSIRSPVSISISCMFPIIWLLALAHLDYATSKEGLKAGSCSSPVSHLNLPGQDSLWRRKKYFQDIWAIFVWLFCAVISSVRMRREIGCPCPNENIGIQLPDSSSSQARLADKKINLSRPW